MLVAAAAVLMTQQQLLGPAVGSAPSRGGRPDVAAGPPPPQCPAPQPLAADAPNILLIGDSVSMGPTGYALFVQDLIETASNGSLGVVQHGGGFGWSQLAGVGKCMASSANGAAKVRDCMGNNSGSLEAKAWSVITYNAGLHDCALTQWVSEADYAFNLRAVFETLKPAAHAVIFVTEKTSAGRSALASTTIRGRKGRGSICVRHKQRPAVGWRAAVTGACLLEH
jgi:hypothetical protein